MLERRFQPAQMKEAAAQDKVAREHQTGSGFPPGQPQEFQAELARFFQIAAHDVKDPRAAESHENITIAEPSGKIEGALVGAAHLGGGVALGSYQSGTERDEKIQLLFEPAVRLGKSPAQRKSAPEQVGRLLIGIPLARISSGPPIIFDGFFSHSGLLEMRSDLAAPAFNVSRVHFGQARAQRDDVKNVDAQGQAQSRPLRADGRA